jgi:molybdate transport system substrate-binding protein
MARLTDAGLVGTPTVFATNVLTIVVPTGNPAGVARLADLARRDVDVVLCAPEVPCGRAAAAVTDAAGVTPHTVSEEPSVTDVLAKVSLGEADAGLVYVTDAATEPEDIETVPTPEAADVVNRYPAAVLSDPPAPDLADEWVALVTGTEGRSALSQAGFGTP